MFKTFFLVKSKYHPFWNDTDPKVYLPIINEVILYGELLVEITLGIACRDQTGNYL